MKTMLVVGGSKGIGAALLKTLSASYNCINISRSQPDSSLPNVTHHALDALEDTLPDIEELHGLAYCPGTINLKPIGSLKDADYLQDFRVNALGAARVIRHYHRTLRQNAVGSVVLFSTVAVSQGMPFHSSVAAAKGAVEGLTRSLAAEFAPHIRVNAIAPTITDTPLASSILRNPKSRDNLINRHPLKFIPQPNQVSDMAAFLLSDAAAAITGQVIGVDAGLGALRV